jgi:acetylornithine deacetylase/succinyl-diaminopimelate desuccinylase-like protein
MNDVDRDTGDAFSAAQRRWFDDACTRIDTGRLRQLVFRLTDIHSPTGAERHAAEFLAGHLEGAGFLAHYQPVTERSGNCIGRLPGDGTGPSLMLYAPLDTHLDADSDLDVPWVGPRLRADMLPKAEIRGDTVIGLGASNPKSMVATLVEAARCVHEAGVPLTGDVIVASAGGGMPWLCRKRDGTGVSSGVRHLLGSGLAPDFGVILKPWDEVFYEHPGMAWFRVTTWGTMGYAGIPRGTPGFTSSIVPAARLILELEQWLTGYPARHETGQVRPEGWIAAIRSGWPDKPAFPAAACEIHLDLRTNPDQSMDAVAAEFSAAMHGILARHPDIRAEWEMTVACPGSRTPKDHWIVRSAMRAWEAAHGRPWAPGTKMSGQTDAATICRLGIPVVRIGYPFIGEKEMPAEFAEGLGGMGVACIPDLILPCRELIYMIIDSCTRTRLATGCGG